MPPSVRVAAIGAQAGVPLPFATGAGCAIPDQCALALATWLVRYMRRGDSIYGGGGYGEPLADTVARDILVERNRAREDETPELPQWDPAVLEQARRWMVRAFDLRRIDVKAPNEVHSYGPSLRRLWAAARRSGVDSWEYIRNSALHWSKAFGPEVPPNLKGGLAAFLGPAVAWRNTEDPAAYLQRTVPWRSTDDPGVPLAAESEGQVLEVRLNDFPDEWVYSPMVDGVDMGDFHDWPAP